MKNPNWAWKPIGEVFDIGAGKTMSAAAREGSRKVPFLRTSNVFWDAIDLTVLDEMTIPPEELSEKSLRHGDLLVCEGGDIGRAAIWEGQITPISFQNHLHRLRSLDAETVPRFYVYFLQSAFTQLGIFEGVGNKTTIPNLSRNRLAALEVPLPDPSEQFGIARVLSEVRGSIRIHEESTKLALQLKSSVMQQLFSRGLRGEPLKETEIGPVPESWSVVSFRDVREWLQYGTSTPCVPAPKRYPVLRIPNVGPGRVNPLDLKYCDLAPEDAAKYLLTYGDLLFIRTNGVLERLGSCAVYEGTPASALFASYIIRARLKKGVSPKFIAYFFGSQLGTSLIAGRATPAADGKYNLNTGTIDSLPLPLPGTEDEQNSIASILEAVDRKVDLHQRKRAVLEELFKSLLHKLMTGEVAVADLDLSALGEAPATTEEVPV